MSGNIADNSHTVYAVVDKAKKKRHDKQEYSSESTNFGVYSLVKSPRATDDKKVKLEQRCEAEANYTESAGGNDQNLEIYSVLERENVSSHLKNKASLNADKESNKVQKYLWVCFIFFIVFLLLLLIIALIAVSANFNSEISTIKAKLSHMEAELANNNSQALLDQSSKLQHVVSPMELNRAITELNSNYSMLEDSVIFSESKLRNEIVILNSTYNFLNERVNFAIKIALFASSCRDLYTNYATFTDGYYFLRLSNGSFIEVYCSNSCNNVPGGWMRVAHLNKENGRAQCFENLRNYYTNPSQCVRTSGACSSVTFPVFHISYTHVCGTVQGFGYNTPDGFRSMNIDQAYVDGISLTYGRPRQHIWTFAAKFNGRTGEPISCQPVSSFVNPNYSCMKSRNDDQCPLQNKCSPEFTRTFNSSTSDDIEMRVCRDEHSLNEEIILDDVELYIH